MSGKLLPRGTWVLLRGAGRLGIVDEHMPNGMCWIKWVASQGVPLTHSMRQGLPAYVPAQRLRVVERLP